MWTSIWNFVKKIIGIYNDNKEEITDIVDKGKDIYEKGKDIYDKTKK